MKNKIRLPGEIAWFIAILLLSFSVAMIASAGFGVSMIVAPAYILSLKFSFLSFGLSEYILQALLFIVFCFLMKGFRLVYLSSFLTCIIYGAVLDLWRTLIPLFNPLLTDPSSIPMALRIFLFITGLVLTGFSVALFFRTYLSPQVYDFFVKSVSSFYNIDRTKFKRIYDASSFLVALVMSLLFFHGIKGIGWGTIVMTLLNSFVIGFFDSLFGKIFDFKPLFPSFASFFETKTDEKSLEKTQQC